MHVYDRRSSLGEGAGLVENHRIDLVGGFQRFDAFEQNARFGSRTGASDDGGGGGETKGAWAGNHQHRDASHQSRFKPSA